MAERFMQTELTPSVLTAREQYFGRRAAIRPAQERDAFTDDEVQFIQSRDTFYMVTVSENGWPDMQHSGGGTGFLRVMSQTQLAFADYRGNRQLLSTGNLAANDRVAPLQQRIAELEAQLQAKP